MKNIFFLTIAFIFWNCISAQTKDSVKVKPKSKQEITLYHMLSNKLIPVKVTEYGTDRSVIMISLHNSETTCVEAAKNVLSQTGGMLIEVQNEGKRLISFTNRRQNFQFDPNRMFSLAGIRSNLLILNRRTTGSAVAAIDSFAKFILRLLPASTKMIVALHNNDEGDYSIQNYTKRGGSGREAAALYISPEADADDFFLTTNRSIFDAISQQHFNIVLQNNIGAADDGSLSIYSGKKKKLYVNVEAQHDHLAQQTAMLKSLAGLLLNPL